MILNFGTLNTQIEYRKKVICSNSFFKDKITSENLRKLQSMITTSEFTPFFLYYFYNGNIYKYISIHINIRKIRNI